jgi:hypothetical protein
MLDVLRGGDIAMVEPVHQLIIWEELARDGNLGASEDPYAR